MSIILCKTIVKSSIKSILNIRKGEIVGIAGLMGAGRTELAMSIFGKSYGKKISGHLYKDGKEIRPAND